MIGTTNNIINKKDSRFELLKIIAMLMIVCHHFITKNAYNVDTQIVGFSASKLFLQLIGNHAFIGNNLFFMTSAWFLSVKSETIDWYITSKRIWRLEKIMLFYSIGIPVVFCLLIGGGKLFFNLSL